MTSGPIHAARPGLAGNHRTSTTTRCECDPIHLIDMNDPGRVVIVHRPMTDPPKEKTR